eukprot:TRINITY_DN6114_c0_g1_i3.p1 TRINITY_DN6114_c0_g1~~TRINITY_DN6114_c0_g1_i3.p1  ORF type:complete len:364 (+),score=94.55 TRINITY_DN6114_c0_g1_i3:141-1232(+)
MKALLLIGCLISLSLCQLYTVCDLIHGQGYPCEPFQVQTVDGFLLTMMRIPHGIKGAGALTAGNKPAVYLQHGLLDSAAGWVVNNAQESLGFILADAGFDVFLGNVRGNTWSSNNTDYSQSSQEYWNLIDFDNMIAIDLPTMIDAVLEKSGQSKTVYIGHSQGTLMGFGGFPNTSIADKVSIFIALAPVAWVDHITAFGMRAIADLDTVLFLEFFGYEAFLPNEKVIDELMGVVCQEEPILCLNSLFLLMGFNANNINTTRLPLYIDYTPAGTSVRNMAHWSQMVKSGKFQMYDYGYIGNLEHYGQFEPFQYYPQFLTNPPVALFSGGNDDLADPTDVAYLTSLLPNVVFKKEVVIFQVEFSS